MFALICLIKNDSLSLHPSVNLFMTHIMYFDRSARLSHRLEKKEHHSAGYSVIKGRISGLAVIK
jgi:hypothetical protein